MALLSENIVAILNMKDGEKPFPHKYAFFALVMMAFCPLAR